MRMTGTERAKLEFKNRFDAVKNRRGWTNRDIAKLLRISTRSVSTLRNDPYSASGKSIMTINALYEEGRE